MKVFEKLGIYQTKQRESARCAAMQLLVKAASCKEPSEELIVQIDQAIADAGITRDEVIKLQELLALRERYTVEAARNDELQMAHASAKAALDEFNAGKWQQVQMEKKALNQRVEDLRFSFSPIAESASQLAGVNNAISKMMG